MTSEVINKIFDTAGRVMADKRDIVIFNALAMRGILIEDRLDREEIKRVCTGRLAVCYATCPREETWLWDFEPLCTFFETEMTEDNGVLSFGRRYVVY